MRDRSHPTIRAAILVSIGVLCIPAAAALAQEDSLTGMQLASPFSLGPTTVGRDGVNWGTSSDSLIAVPGEAFQEAETTNVFSYSVFGGGRYRISGGLFFDAWPDVPQGAQLQWLELEACDTSATAEAFAFFFQVPSPAGLSSTVLASVSTGAAATPGCDFFLAPFPASTFVDRFDNRYQLRLNIGGVDETVRVRAVRVFYRLRVSPAPATPTFTDVPTTHPFFQFIEALAASGITAGCNATPPMYCPDASLTRGQMAVFLARALGLHFPN